MVDDFRITIVGKTGHGKSTTGNSLLGKKIFKSSFLPSSQSQQCEKGDAQTSIGRLNVVDTPGLFDTSKPNDETIKELVKCLGLLAPGPHVFVFTLKCGIRFTPEELATVEILKKTFGDEIMKHMILVFTSKDELDKHNNTIAEYLNQAPECLKQLLRDVNNRYAFICNQPENRSHAQDVKNVLSLINKTIQQNSINYYTQEMFQAVEEVIKKEIQEKQKIERKSDEECRQEIQADIVNNKPSILDKLIDALKSIITTATPYAFEALSLFMKIKMKK